AHVGFADPFCPNLSASLYEAARRAGATIHRGGAYVVMEGPAFSTRAESHVYRSWGASIIGMTALPEAKLAREAEMCYATLACVTDYDVWHESEADVSVEVVVANLQANTQTAQRALRTLAEGLSDERACGCGDALAAAIVTSPAHIGVEARERLAPIIGKYLA
ncbi:MAG: S-methyl-5'-thioadenosine phosphorylase, partial [Chloroflexota bacterium]|nr:S-methyl-5'-thioadenosine phosphorylase [Chloroflexota bacterium]